MNIVSNHQTTTRMGATWDWFTEAYPSVLFVGIISAGMLASARHAASGIREAFMPPTRLVPRTFPKVVRPTRPITLVASRPLRKAPFRQAQFRKK